MSICAIRFCCKQVLKPSVKILLLEFCIAAGTHEPFYSALSLMELAKKTSLSKQAVIAGIKELKKCGYLKETNRISKKKKCKVYQVMIPPYDQAFLVIRGRNMPNGMPEDHILSRKYRNM